MISSIDTQFHKALDRKNWNEATTILESVTDYYLSHRDPIYKLIDSVHSSGDNEGDWEQLLDKMINLKWKSSLGILRALQCNDIHLANKLHEKGYPCPQINVIYSINAMYWAKEHNIDVNSDAFFEIISVWNGDAVVDRVIMLFTYFNYINYISQSHINDLYNKDVFIAIYPFVANKFSNKFILEKAQNLSAIPVLMNLKLNGCVIDYKKALNRVTTYSEIAIICSLCGKQTKDVLTHVLRQNIEDGDIINILKDYFNVCYRHNYLQEAVMEDNSFGILVKKGKYKAAIKLAKLLRGDEHAQFLGGDMKSYTVNIKPLIQSKINDWLEYNYDGTREYSKMCKKIWKKYSKFIDPQSYKKGKEIIKDTLDTDDIVDVHRLDEFLEGFLNE